MCRSGNSRFCEDGPSGHDSELKINIFEVTLQNKKTRGGVPCQRQVPFLQAALPILSGLRQITTRSPRPPCRMRRRVFFGVLPGGPELLGNGASLGREKGACDGLRRHPLIDPIFGSAMAWHPDLLPILSASFAGWNLHLVISASRRDPAAGSPLFSCDEQAEFYRQRPASSSVSPR